MKIFRSIFFVLCIVFFLGVTVFAQNEDQGEPIYDPVCQRDNILQPDSCYARNCKIWGNTESGMDETLEYCNEGGDDTDYCGLLNVFCTDLEVNVNTLPHIFRAFVNIFLGVAALGAMYVIFWGMYLWLSSGGSQDQIRSAWQWFLNGMFGIAIVGGSFIVTQALFYGLGYRLNPFDFEEDIKKALGPPCESFDEDVCQKYDISCVVEGGGCTYNLEE